MLRGIGISSGIGIGKVYKMERSKIEIRKNKIENPENELRKLEKAIENVKKNIESSQMQANGIKKEILNAYIMILEDESLVEETMNLIKNEKYNVLYAVEEGFNNIAKVFENIGDNYIRERARDIIDIKQMVLENLKSNQKDSLDSIEEGTILVTKELTTSESTQLDLSKISGIITEIGGENSHMAIIARDNSIPAITGIQSIFDLFKNGDIVAINGENGEIVLNPSNDKIEEERKKKKYFDEKKKKLEQYKNKEAITIDGIKIHVMANIGGTKDIKEVVENYSDGVGLFRTEFLYMNKKCVPSEEEQFESYRSVAEKMKGKQVIIRTMDIGGDKELEVLGLNKESNPFLGYRAIRICLEEKELFKTQLRAILRASAYGNLSIMFPMISSIEELLEAKKIVSECKNELFHKNIDFDENIKIGIMIEIPAAAIMAKELAKECDFFSIGTNDLIQYTIAAERGNEKVAKLYTKYHPAVIRLIKNAIDGAHNSNIFCGMCGEAASDSRYIPLLIGLGLDEFSVTRSKILETKGKICNLSKMDCEKIAEKVIQAKSTDQVEKIL